jgi:adenosylmethionine-8-amino-7-oxononanoate aminotransferase
MSLSQRDQQVIWHPYTQMQDAPPPLPVVAGDGAWLVLEDGRRVLDMIASWWVTVHGHAHPQIAQAIATQAQVLEQVIFAGFTHPQAVRLAERLLGHLPGDLARVFYSDDGSTAVEVALKMAWQYWQNKGEPRSHIVALADAYHGDTFGAMSVSGRSVFTRAFEPLLFHVSHIPSPDDAPTPALLAALQAAHAQSPIAALLLEPLIQGAGGMKMYGVQELDAITAWCKARGILVIFDEVMTGFYRTGSFFAASQATVAPDIICLSKGLTGGFLPLAVTACTAEVYNAFLSDDRSKMLFHGHSFTANPLGCAAANASLDLFESAGTQAAIAAIVAQQGAAVQRFATLPQVAHVRVCGTILAMDLRGEAGYLQRRGAIVAARMLERGIFLRPLGNVIYLMPPYVTTTSELTLVHDALEQTLLEMD